MVNGNENWNNLEKIKCPHCLQHPYDAWIIVNKFNMKHLYIKCRCRKQPFNIPFEQSKGLDIPIKETREQRKINESKMQNKLL